LKDKIYNMRSKGKRQLHPEGLTPNQEKLADLLITTKTQAKVRRREQIENGCYKFTEVIRDTSPVDFAQEGEFALKLHEKNPGAPLSPIYINLRNLPENILDQVGRVLVEIPSKQKPDFCTGIPSAGDPIAKAYSKFSGIEVKDIFLKTQTEAGRRIVSKETKDAKKQKVRIVDDLVTQADTKVEAIKAAEASGYEVIDLVVIVDREQGGSMQLAKEGHKLCSAFTLSQLLNYYRRTGKITQIKYDEVKAYLSAGK